MSILDDQQKVTYDGRTSEVVVRKRTGRKINGAFSAIGPLTNKKRKRSVMQEDVFDLLDQVSKGAFHVFRNLKYNRNEENNVTQYEAEEEMTTHQKESLSRRLKELRKVNVIRKVKKRVERDEDTVFTFKDPRNTYVINPDLIKCKNHEEAAHLWSQCG